MSQQDGGGSPIVFRVLLVLLLAGVTIGAVWLLAVPTTLPAGPVDPSADVVAVPVKPDTVAPGRAITDSDVTGWAAKMSASTGIPVRAVQAYGNAELVLRAAEPACHLSWNTLAGIGRVESDHGQYGGAQLSADGTETKPIIGVPLNGSGGVQNIPDTDHGTLDGDPVHDHAVGPMQFLPTTWREYADRGADPQSIDAAAVAAGRYLCADGRNLATARGWWAAILSYNDSVSYAQKVFGLANSYTGT
ncbi:MAG TPA: murein transglycosylase [Pseudonocardiaceae bacterium]